MECNSIRTLFTEYEFGPEPCGYGAYKDEETMVLVLKEFTAGVLVSSGRHYKVHRLGGLNLKNFVLTVLEARSPGPRCLQGSFLLKPPRLAADGPLLTVSSHGLPSVRAYL